MGGGHSCPPPFFSSDSVNSEYSFPRRVCPPRRRSGQRPVLRGQSGKYRTYSPKPQFGGGLTGPSRGLERLCKLTVAAASSSGQDQAYEAPPSPSETAAVGWRGGVLSFPRWIKDLRSIIS